MNNNPLVAPIAQILRECTTGISEYELLRQLESNGFQLELESDITSELLLFRKHFLIMNALYYLQSVLCEEEFYLSISALNIKLQPIVADSTDTLPDDAHDQALREYYLDWSQFEQSSTASVEQLLNDFWKRYYAEDKKQYALGILQLKPGCNRSQIRAAYRRLASVHHPDRGGDIEQFRQVREAYELMISCQV